MRFLLFVILSFLCSRSAAADKRPNFLFIFADDQRYDALSVVQKEQGEKARFPWFRTPHMDRLAAEGVRFRNAFVVSSLCSPSRAALLTGRYNHINGVASNFRAFPVGSETHATILRAAGYTTGYVGKWHMGSQRERPGFDFVASFIGHARYVDPVFILDGKDTPQKGWIDDLSTDHAITFLKKQKDAVNPWSLIVGFKSPHGPFDPPARAKDRFAGELARRVPNFSSPAPYNGPQKPPEPPASDKVPVNLGYLRCISAADDCLGRILDALDENGQTQNTVVIYSSDNGYYLGEHGLGDKRSAYDESLRIPFLIRAPMLGDTARSKVLDETILNIDLAPTLLELAGAKSTQPMHGRSLLPLLRGETKDWRQSWFYEYFAENQKNSRVPDITAVRTTTAKLIKYPGHDDWTELFDLRADPYETKNLFADAAHAELRSQLEQEHARLLTETGYRVPDYTDRPPWWKTPGSPDNHSGSVKPLRLAFDAAKLDGVRLPDTSGNGNDGAARGITRVDADGKTALRFDGNGFIELPSTKTLNPANSAWTIEAVLKPDKPSGVIAARGGRTNGYALWLKDGRPAFTVVVSGKSFTAEAKDPVTGWTTLAGVITPDKHVEVRLDGNTAARIPLPGFIPADPKDGMEIGADHDSQVLESATPGFTGVMQSLRILSGPPEEKR